MAEQPESVETTSESPKLSEVTVWMLISEIRTATHGKDEPVLRPDGYEIRFGEGDSAVTVYDEDDESDQALYRLYVEDLPDGWKLEVSERNDPTWRVELDETGGLWFRELIAEGNRWKNSPKGRA